MCRSTSSSLDPTFLMRNPGNQEGNGESSADHPPDFECGLGEIEDKTVPLSSGLEVGSGHGKMDVLEVLDGLELHDNCIFNEHIQAMLTYFLARVVNDHFDLRLGLKSSAA